MRAWKGDARSIGLRRRSSRMALVLPVGIQRIRRTRRPRVHSEQSELNPLCGWRIGGQRAVSWRRIIGRLALAAGGREHHEPVVPACTRKFTSDVDGCRRACSFSAAGRGTQPRELDNLLERSQTRARRRSAEWSGSTGRFQTAATSPDMLSLPAIRWIHRCEAGWRRIWTLAGQRPAYLAVLVTPGSEAAANWKVQYAARLEKWGYKPREQTQFGGTF